MPVPSDVMILSRDLLEISTTHSRHGWMTHPYQPINEASCDITQHLWTFMMDFQLLALLRQTVEATFRREVFFAAWFCKRVNMRVKGVLFCEKIWG